jgi:hypothetical protein
MPQPATLKLRMNQQLRTAIEEAAKAHGCSLNAEITVRLHDSFDQVTHTDVLDAVSMISRALVALNDVAKHGVDLLEALRDSDHPDAWRATVIAKGTIRVQERLFAVSNKLMPGAAERHKESAIAIGMEGEQ